MTSTSFAIILAGYSSMGGFVDGNMLLSWCRMLNDGAPETECSAYLMGVSDTYHTISLMKEDKGRFICVPDGATPRQLRDVVVRYLENAPESRDLPAPTLALAAVASSFPCATPSRK